MEDVRQQVQCVPHHQVFEHVEPDGNGKGRERGGGAWMETRVLQSAGDAIGPNMQRWRWDHEQRQTASMYAGSEGA